MRGRRGNQFAVRVLGATGADAHPRVQLRRPAHGWHGKARAARVAAGAARFTMARAWSGRACAPGALAHVVDLSSGGALIETDWRLLPGMRVEMQVGEPVPLFRVAGRILRCHVALLDRERIRYRGALMFDEQLPFGEVATQWSKPLT